MKAESLVIVDQHATVNGLRPCTHRPSRQGRESGLKDFIGSIFIAIFCSQQFVDFLLLMHLIDIFLTVMKS